MKTKSIAFVTFLVVLATFMPYNISAKEQKTNNEISISALPRIQTYPAAINSIFPDALLAKGVADKLNKQVTETVTKAELETITTLEVHQLVGTDLFVQNLTGLEELSNLTYLDLSNNHISDISQVDWTSLNQLQTLLLNNNGIADISGVNWTALTTLNNVSLANQRVGLFYQEYDTHVTAADPIKNPQGVVVPLINITDNGIYDANTEEVSWVLSLAHELEEWGKLGAEWDESFTLNGVTVPFNGTAWGDIDFFPEPFARFLDWDGKVIIEERVKPGDPIAEPTISAREGYKFVRWSPKFIDVMPIHNVTFKAIYEAVNPVPTPEGTTNPERTCQEDGYPIGYDWNGTACVYQQSGYKVPNTGVQ